ncbi:5'-nucleotidase C-terminal domain-containing protein [Peptoniphilus sp. KCTC 25270]|uniref:5'-nucleotidase C-terminal domain-containing protein n=1 Tax=Peptoniphilus sp. KCTC 25270 TaxID=2897414 RepID=UPI001E517986|nr:5'-nucleotidase C-terminal domain-containing protein [Peptoniphilus sp. KCTC 25270]MCD1146763.1 5'-nucleotidase C-terminal domain-containing protein [Peptoniphilus sp. KCTC 25270]
MKKRFTGALLAVAMLFSIVAVPVDAMAASVDTKEITIVHTNDAHGRAEENADNKEIGYAKLKTYFDSLSNAILIDAGDTVHGTTFATISRGESMINLMNEMGFVASTPGNHDFNYGYERLKELDKKANFPYLAANVITTSGANELAKNVVVDVNGVKVGIFGLATDETKTKSNPLNTEGVLFLNPIEVAREQVKELKAQGAEVIVANSHLGLDESSVYKSSDVAEAVEGIDVIIDGHSHTSLPSGKMVKDTLIVQTGGQMTEVGEVKLQVKDGEVVTKSGKVLDYNFFNNITPNEKILAMISAIQESNKPYLEKVVGSTAVELDGVREHVRAGETNLGNLLTDAMLDVSGADVAITNGGGIRASIDKGDITMGEILTSFPFTNYPVKLEVTGQIIKDALEFGVNEAPEVVGKFPHVAGMTFKYDEKQPAGSRVFDVMVKGQALDLNKTYTLVTNDFMAIGGDGYEMFKAAKKLSEYPLLSEVLANYIEKAKIVSPKVEDRVVAASKTGETDPKFTDIKGHWAESVILDVVEKGYFKGMTETTFEPNTKISRGMLVTTLARLEGEDKAQADAKKDAFKDVPANEWYSNAVDWAVKHELIKGYDDGSFKPNQEVTREEMATILGRFISYKKYAIPAIQPEDFADQKDISEWAAGYITAVRVIGIMEGRDDNTFDPKGHATRAELAKVIFELAEIEDKVPAPEEKVETTKPAEQPVEKAA